MTNKNFRLYVEGLEARETPSAVATSPSAVATLPTSHVTSTVVSTTTTTVTQTHALGGSATGTYICTLEYGTMPSGYHFTGQGTVKGMGIVQIQIDVYGVGFHTTGTAHGTMTLSNAKGSVTVQLTGPIQPKLSALPSWFEYKIVQGTGAYTNLRDSGTMSLIRTPDKIPVKFGLRFFETGSFRLALQ
jgi:hypothetical protein